MSCFLHGTVFEQSLSRLTGNPRTPRVQNQAHGKAHGREGNERLDVTYWFRLLCHCQETRWY
jgi:hypothetical protein